MNGHEIALWSGIFTFFGSLIAAGIFDIFSPDQWIEYLGALIVAFITAASVYSKQRLDDAREALQYRKNVEKLEQKKNGVSKD